MKKGLLFIGILWCLGTCTSLLAQQLGGENTYDFLQLSPSARITAFGGDQIAIMDDDLSLSSLNPALYNPQMDTHLSLNTVAYLAGINHGYAAYAKAIDSLATFGIAMQYVAYGNFALTDPSGQVQGDFSGGEYALILGGARQWNYFSYGANVKLISSNFESYRSWGLATDFGVSYYHPEKELGLALVAKNIGTQFSAYTNNGEKESLPIDVQLGFTKRLKYLPLRLSITAHHLHQWDIRYDDPNQQTTNFLGEEEDTGNHTFDKVFRHLNFAGELYLGKALRLRFGYNHLRRQELGVESRRSLAGISFGGGIHIKRFHIDYGRAVYHVAGGTHHFSISTKLSEWVSKSN